MTGEPLMKAVPWEVAVQLFKGECTWSPEHNVYGKLTAALPESGYPTCDFTGASVRRLQATSNSTANGTTGATPSPPTPTPPTPTPPTPTPPTTGSTANTTTSASNTTNTTSTPAPPTPAPPSGVASGASSVKIEA